MRPAVCAPTSVRLDWQIDTGHHSLPAACSAYSVHWPAGQAAG